jgi:type IV secretory pathway TraG/TraD family ATPase VirD4
VTARKLSEAQAAQVQAYLDSLAERQRRELAGVRDRLAILAESEVRRWLQPIPTVVMIDEFSAITAGQVNRLFGRARSAGISLILGAQELADLKSTGQEALREQVLANLSTLITHRQNVPESAELIAQIAGTRAVWVSIQQTEDGLLATGPSGKGSRRRGYEFQVHPSRIKRLGTGQAVLITPGTEQAPAVVLINYPGAVRE